MYIDFPIAALILMRQFHQDAEEKASLKAAAARAEGDLEEAGAWSQVAWAIRDLQTLAPKETDGSAEQHSGEVTI